MPCIEPAGRRIDRSAASFTCLFACAAATAWSLFGCAGSSSEPPAQIPSGTQAASRGAVVPSGRPSTPLAAARGALPPPGPVHSWEEVRRQAAERLIAANPTITYRGKVPETLLAIPVLEIELNGDGSVRRIEILRQPRQAKDTQQIAIDAVRRAAPFGNVSKLKRPWKFVETFLFDDDRKFKPRTLDD